MNKYPYKSVIALDIGVTGAEADVMTGKIKTLVEASGGKILSVEKISSSRLAFRVKGRIDANHLVVQFDSTPEALTEAEAWLRLQNGVLRVMTTRRTALETLATEQAQQSAGSAS